MFVQVVLQLYHPFLRTTHFFTLFCSLFSNNAIFHPFLEYRSHDQRKQNSDFERNLIQLLAFPSIYAWSVIIHASIQLYFITSCFEKTYRNKAIECTYRDKTIRGRVRVLYNQYYEGMFIFSVESTDANYSKAWIYTCWLVSSSTMLYDVMENNSAARVCKMSTV